MQKVKFTLPTSGKWSSVVTKYNPLSAMVSADSFTEGSENFLTHLNGNIEKRWTDSLYNTTNLGSGPLNDYYEMVFGNGTRNIIFRDNTALWFTSGNNLAYEVYSPVNANGFFEYITYLNVGYMDNAIDPPLSYDINGVYGGVTYIPVEIAVTNYLDLVGGTIKVGNTTLHEGTQYHATTSNAATTASIVTAINAIAGTPYVAVNNAGVISVTNTSPTLTTPIAISGSTGYTLSPISFPRVREMGVTPPTTAVTFAANSAGGAVPIGAHTYVITFLYYGFEESNGGPSSLTDVVSSPNQTVNLTAVPIGGYGVTARNIYRDNNDGNYVLVGTLPNNTATTFQDSQSVGTLPLIYTNGLPPVYGLTCLWLSRDFVAEVPGEPSTLYWSTANQMDSWNPDNFLVCNPSDTITGLVVFQGSLFVFNQFSFGYITGTTDSSFAYQAVPSSNIGCIDNRTIQTRVVEGIPELIFCSDKGVYAWNGSSLRYISDPIEPDINVNISQAGVLAGTNTQASLSDWEAGTSTPGIDLTSDPGVLTTINPTASYSTFTEWETGTLTGTSTDNVTDTLYLPNSFAPVISAGTNGGSAFTAAGMPTQITSTTSTWLSTGASTNVDTTTIPGSFSREWSLLSDFASGSYSVNPTWSVASGTTAVSNIFGPQALYWINTTGSVYLPIATGNVGSWSYYPVSLDGLQSTGQYLNVWFIADSGTNPQNGYYIRYYVGIGPQDRISIYKRVAGTDTELAFRSPLDGFLGYNVPTVITRTAAGVITMSTGAMTATDTFSPTSNAIVAQSSSGAYLGSYGTALSDLYFTYNTNPPAANNSQGVLVMTIDQLVVPTAEGAVTYSATLPAGTSVSVATATSASSGSGYTSFVALGALGAIVSPANRYIRVQFTLNCPVDSGVTEASLASPIVTNVTVTWNPDDQPMILVNSTSTPVSGTWTSPVYNSNSTNDTAIPSLLSLVGDYPAGTAVSITINGSTSPTMSPITTTQTLSSPTTGTSLSMAGAQYFQVIYTLSSTNGLYTPYITPPILEFNTSGTWVSPVITTTTDITTFASLITTAVLNGETVTTTIRTGNVPVPDGSWTGYVAIGSATPGEYAQIKLALSTSTAGITPVVSSTILDWNLTSTFISQAIDTTASPPSGFGLFTVADFLNGGIITWAVRTAASEAGLSSAAWITLAPGTIPTNTPLEWIQWEAVFKSTAGDVPQVDSVTMKWLTGTGAIPTRMASLFYDKTYYLFAPAVGSSINNVCFEFDYLNNWREFNNIYVNDIGTFFATPYYLDGLRNNIYQWQVLLTGSAWGPAIPAPLLASSATYALLAATTITNTGSSIITGNLGLFPGTSVTLGAATVTGTQNVANVAAQQAQTDATAAYNALEDMTPTMPLNTTLSGATLTAGVYPYSSSASLTGNLTLSGSATDVFVFQITSTLTTASSSQVILTGGVVPQNVFWQVGSSATLGASSIFNGSILANTSITVDGVTDTDIQGQLIALTGAITIAAIADVTSVGNGSTSGPIPFTMDVRTKDFNLSDMTTLKNARSCWVGLTNTGTTITVYYSTDNGNSWIQMLESSTGANTYTTSTAGNMCNVRFVPDYTEYLNAVEGTSLMFRVVSSDSFPTQILFITPGILARSGTYIGVGL